MLVFITMNNLFIISNLIFLFISSISVSSEFIPPSNEVCTGDSILFQCSFNGNFLNTQTFTINDVGLTIFQITNLNSSSGVDLTRFSATEENIQDLTTGFYTSLRTNITLVSITKEDNGTQIGCKATDTDSLIGIVEKSDTLILASPPSQPTIQLTSILSNCTVRLQWTYPTQSTLPLTQHITDSVITNNMIPVQGHSYLSDFLTAGENISYTLSAVNCIGFSVTAVSQVFSPPSQPVSYSCTADYGTENGVLVLRIVSYNSEYTIQTGYVITDDTDNSIVLSGNFSVDNPFYYYSQDIIEINSTRHYTVVFTSLLRYCMESMSTSCQIMLNITAVVTEIPSPTTNTTTTHTNTTTTSTSPPATPPGLPPYTIYIVVAIILFLLLLFLSCIIILLACILGRGKLSRSKCVPKDAKRLPDPASTPENNPESDPNVEELHYITPDFSTNSTKPKSPIPKTLYSDISEMPVATEAMSSL